MGGVKRCDFWKIVQFEAQSVAREGGMSGSRTGESVQSAGGSVRFRQGEEVDSEFRSGRREGAEKWVETDGKWGFEKIVKIGLNLARLRVNKG